MFSNEFAIPAFSSSPSPTCHAFQPFSNHYSSLCFPLVLLASNVTSSAVCKARQTFHAYMHKHIPSSHLHHMIP
ncbi:hypothetical protein BCV70DRAFT_14807 [Testicularia cyperi]|uniref:Uncharacterized protein n=1 Tax=Testicularia cyperi TaxID=1882483 RepID=A0A317XYB8_9BASI|nr:hypothetical protein BCV70DRAFT_14807 [Testicularia cyperi]